MLFQMFTNNIKTLLQIEKSDKKIKYICRFEKLIIYTGYKQICTLRDVWKTFAAGILWINEVLFFYFM